MRFSLLFSTHLYCEIYKERRFRLFLKSDTIKNSRDYGGEISNSSLI